MFIKPKVITVNEQYVYEIHIAVLEHFILTEYHRY
jgi:hypothetical protein